MMVFIYISRPHLRRECRKFPHANNDVILSKTCEIFRVFRVATCSQWEMQEPLIRRNMLQNLQQDSRRHFGICTCFSSGLQSVSL